MDGKIIDLVIIGLVLIFSLIGFYKGFLRELVSLIGFFGSLVISYFASGYFTNILNGIVNWGTVISNAVVNQISGISANFATDIGTTVEELQAIINVSDANLAYKEILKSFNQSRPVRWWCYSCRCVGNNCVGFCNGNYLLCCVILAA